jgi:mRNA-degrading endonuclease toxin of MazEF toxin-antitoxin module
VTFSRWDVVAIGFPFLEGGDSKRRPALIVSSDRLRRDFGLYWVVMITTAKAGVRPDDIVITDRERAGLPQECVIRVSRIAVVAQDHMTRRLGDITTKDRTAVVALLRRYLP